MTSSDEQPKIPERWRQFYAEVCRAAKFFRNTDPSPAKSLIEELGTAEARVAELEAQVDAIREDNARSYAEMKRGYEAQLAEAKAENTFVYDARNRGRADRRPKGAAMNDAMEMGVADDRRAPSMNYMQRVGKSSCIRCDFETDESQSFAEQDAAMHAHLAEKHPNWMTEPLTAEQQKALNQRCMDPKDRRIRELEEQLQRISDWCEAYPLDVFTEPDMEQVRRLLGDTLLTQLSAHNFRHVLDGIKGIIAPQSGGK